MDRYLSLHQDLQVGEFLQGLWGEQLGSRVTPSACFLGVFSLNAGADKEGEAGTTSDWRNHSGRVELKIPCAGPSIHVARTPSR